MRWQESNAESRSRWRTRKQNGPCPLTVMSTVTRLLHEFIHTSSHKPHVRGTQVSQLARCTRNFHTQPRARDIALTRLTHTHVSQRTFSSSSISRAFKSATVESEPTELAAAPSPELKDDIDLVPVEQATLRLTRRAAEQIHTIAERRQNPAVGLRVRVDSGGCHGYQYAIELAEGRQPDDYVFSHKELKPSNVYIDAVSLALMKGSLIDFATELIGSSFRVDENPQAKGSGCGCGVSWELKDDVVL